MNVFRTESLIPSLLAEILRLDNGVVSELIDNGLVYTKRPEGMLKTLINRATRENLLFTAMIPQPEGLLGYLAATRKGNWLHIEEIAVDETRRQNGVGTKLVLLLQNEARVGNFFGISLTTDIGRSASYALFLKLGFSIADKSVPYLERTLCNEAKYFTPRSQRRAMIWQVTQEYEHGLDFKK